MVRKVLLSGRFKSKETNYAGFITKRDTYIQFLCSLCQKTIFCSFRIHICFFLKQLFLLVLTVSSWKKMEKFYFVTGVTLKFYQKSNSSPKNNLFSTFSRKYFTKKSKNNCFQIKHVSTCFITLKIFFYKMFIFLLNFTSLKLIKIAFFCTNQIYILKLQNVVIFLTKRT